MITAEERRLADEQAGVSGWRLWGPYLSERQWGTVREDYSATGHAWEYFPYEHSRSRTYRWGEDGIAGISDDRQYLCFSLALWNYRDAHLKERLFGLTNQQGNHGEDVKEYYFYLDNVPSHAYMKYLYKYPQGAFPYEDLVRVNGQRTRLEFEYELLDTGIFDQNRYFDVFVEYCKQQERDIFIRITAANRGPEDAKLCLLPTLWFKNTWVWDGRGRQSSIKAANPIGDVLVAHASHEEVGDYYLYCRSADALLFTENETNNEALYSTKNTAQYVKDGINNFIVGDVKTAVNPAQTGSKAAAQYALGIKAGEEQVVYLRLSWQETADPFPENFADIFSLRKQEADDFYKHVTPYDISEDMRNVQRQAFAGLLWNKQFYHYNVEAWLAGDPAMPKPPVERLQGRNSNWKHVNGRDIFSMPDKWEYPWFAAWDLAYHTIPLAMIDPGFAKQQLRQLTKVWYIHPSGQLPAYEWAFGDVNPPVQAWAALRIYQIESLRYNRKDRAFLEAVFEKLLLYFTWWVNRKDIGGKNIFEGGFLGLDNIGPIDRTHGLEKGEKLEQVDGTSWMGMFCLNMLEIALELAIEDPVYQDMATKFFGHFIDIADAMNTPTAGRKGLWDEQRGFYYGNLVTADGQQIEITERSFVSLTPVFAVATSNLTDSGQFKKYRDYFDWFVKHRSDLLKDIGDWSRLEGAGPVLLSLTNPAKLKRILKIALDPEEFLSDYGIRSVSKYHLKHPFVIAYHGKALTVDYEPAESTTSLFGGNSNWRGPIWFPTNFLFIESLQKFHYYLGDGFTVEHPAGSGKQCSLWDVSEDICLRMINIFLKNKDGRRPVYGGTEKFQTDPHWRDYILFHEYFHGDNGAGLGASNQTGWTALVAKMIDQYGKFTVNKTPPKVLESAEIPQG